MIYFAFMFVIVLILIVFLYSIWKDEEKIKDLQNQKSLYEGDVIESFKKGSLDGTNFMLGLKNISISNQDFLELKNELSKKIIGMEEFVNSILITLLVGGHLLVEGVPGLAKTKTIETISKLMDLDAKRIQFTPDMLPSDIIGVEIYNTKTGEFELKRGPVFTNILLADEINRTTPKVQSALLEAMQERKVTIGNNDLILPQPFFVLATQNPIEQEGTYSLPEAQVDRFLFKVLVDYPDIQQEKQVLDMVEKEQSISLFKVIDKDKLISFQNSLKNILVSDDVKDYIVRLVAKTREANSNLIYGASPRASIGLMMGAKALAFLQGRDYVIHEDVQRIAVTVLRHRVVLSYDAKVDGLTEDKFLTNILPTVTLA